MDDLMNKVGALIEEHVKNEVEARALIHSIQIKECQARECSCPSKDEIRRGVRALGFWEKLVETLCLGPAKEATFDDAMAKIQTLREERDSIARIADIRFKVIEAERSVANDALARRDKAVADAEEKADALDNLRTILEDERKAFCTVRDERDEAKAQLEVACAKVRELDAQLLEVRRAIGANVPAEEIGFRAGDLVRIKGGIGHSRIIAIHAHGIELSTHNPCRSFDANDLIRKPIEVGDTVRVVGGTYAGSVAKCIRVKGKYALWKSAENASVAGATSNLVAIAP